MKKKIAWKELLFIAGYHLILLIGLPLFFIYSSVSWPVIAAMVLLWGATGMSVTAGFHRLYAHQAYQAHPLIEGIFLFFGAMACQGSAYTWAHDHRLHHAYTDTEQDPYSVVKGFLHAHLLWMFTEGEALDRRIVRDLERKRLVMHQHRHYLLWMIGSNVLVTLLGGWLFGSFIASFLFIFALRVFLCHHCTWFINSLAHHWGARTFSKEQSAVDNYILSILTFGEGYHNYHHTFARDYRNGIRWYHFDPTKWLIWVLSKCGLARSLVKVHQVRVRTKMVSEQRSDLLARIKTSLHAQQEALCLMVRTLSDEILALGKRLKELTEREKREGISAKQERRLLEQRLVEAHRIWRSISRRIERLRPAPACPIT